MSHVFSLDQENATAEHKRENTQTQQRTTEHRVCDDRTCRGKMGITRTPKMMLGMILSVRLVDMIPRLTQ